MRSVRVDDHADDFKTDRGIVLRPGESLTARIDSDVASYHPGLNSGDWAYRPIRAYRIWAYL